MTEYYDRKTVNNRHSIRFPQPQDDGYHYYDFDTQTWFRCYPQDRLPYGLCSFRLEGKDESQSVVTCLDSYRLSKNIPKHTDHDEMLAEKEWRDDMYNTGKAYEFDWQLNDGTWVKGGIAWTKADIVPGVCMIGPRDHPNVNGWGYYYKESRRYAKACTHTPVIIQEELDEEKKKQEEAQERIKTRKRKVAEWKKKLRRLSPKEFVHLANQGSGFSGSIGFYDLLPYYLSLKRDPNETTVESILVRMSPEDTEMTRKSLKEIPTLTGLFEFVDQNSVKVKPKEEKYEVVFDAGETTPKETNHYAVRDQKGVKSFELNESDGFFDIRVYNATYCYLWISHNNYEDRKIEMVPVKKLDSELKTVFSDDLCQEVLSYEGDYLTLEDITYDNPLFPSVMGAQLRFFTDGDRVTYKNIWIAYEPRTLFTSFENMCAISHFPSKNTVLMLGHLWQSSMSCSYDDLVDVTKKPEEK